ncbi:MAG: contractile injection system tape measure protein [Saprospiraceae bacterium]
MTHRIDRQIIELVLPTGVDAEERSRCAAALFEEKVLPHLDETFTRLAPDDRILRIPQLQIDLGVINPEDWERHFVESCLAQMRAALRDFPTAGALDAPQPAGVVLNPEEDARQILLFFLEKGRLPWHASGCRLSALETLLSGSFPAPFARALSDLLRRRPEALQRLIWQFSLTWTQALFEKIYCLSDGWIAQTLNQMRSLQPYLPFDTQLQEAGGPLWLLCRNLLRVRADELFDLSPEQAARRCVGMASDDPHVAPASPTTEAVDAQAPFSTSSVEQFEASQPQETSLGLAVENAGIVLLGPYLQAFFDELGLSQGDSFVEQMAQYRAAYLLYFLATGEEQPEEPVLLLQKILCGLPQDAPIPAYIPLSAAEKAESLNLLEAVTRNWTALKNTSPNGLRQGFLQRPGSLYDQTGADQIRLLRIERRGQDLLLDRLPWSYSMIKLPWMKSLLQVEW